MDLNQYLQKKESAAKSVRAYDGKYSLGKYREGELAVTPNRVVFTRTKRVYDISLNGVDSIEYHEPTYPSQFLYLTASTFCLSLLLFAIGLAPGEMSSGVRQFGGILFLASLAIGLLGFLFRRSTIILNTPNKTYEFVSQNGSLDEIAHALRGYEQG